MTTTLSKQSPKEIRQSTLEDVVAAAGLVNGLFYSITASADGFPVAAEVLPIGRPELVATLSRMRGMRLGDHGTMEAITRFGNFELQLSKDLPPAFVHLVWKPLGIRASFGMNVMDGERYVGWIGAYFCDEPIPSGQRVLARVQKLADDVSSRLKLAARIEDAICNDGGSMVFQADGVLEAQSEGSVDWWANTANAEQLTAEVAAMRKGDYAATTVWIGGSVATLERLMPGRKTVVTLTPHESLAIPPIALLSRPKRLVAQLVAEGLNSAEIAKAIHRSEETVRSHLKSIYAELGFTGRVELAVAVQAMSRPPAKRAS